MASHDAQALAPVTTREDIDSTNDIFDTRSKKPVRRRLARDLADSFTTQAVTSRRRLGQAGTQRSSESDKENRLAHSVEQELLRHTTKSNPRQRTRKVRATKTIVEPTVLETDVLAYPEQTEPRTVLRQPRFVLARPGSHRTSNHTLAALPTLNQTTFRNWLKKASPTHATERDQLMRLYAKQFPQWFFELRAGFNVLLYGFGSKRKLMLNFARTMLTDAPVIIVNGFSPVFSPKEMIEKITSVLPDTVRGAGTLLDQAKRIVDHFAEVHQSNNKQTWRHIYLLINNIECTGLERAHNVLATLAASPHIQCIASIDHIQAGLLWDSASAAQFKWIAHDVATFTPYTAETSHDNILLARAEALDGRGARYVLSSLTSNARGMFRLLAQHQLAHGRQDERVSKHAQKTSHDASDEEPEEDHAHSRGHVGLAYSAFYTLCRENFLVSNDLTFRTQLTEFRDHRLMLTRRALDGEELFYIPLDATVLESLIEELA
jgi:origin recognition complex subunit 2